MSDKVQEVLNARWELEEQENVWCQVSRGVEACKIKVAEKERDLIKQCQAAGVDKFDTKEHKVEIKKAGTKVVVLDEREVPSKYLKTEILVDEMKLKAWLVNGDADYAKIEQQYKVEINENQ